MKALEILKKLESKMLNITQWDVEEAIIEIEAMQEHNKEWFIKIITLTKQSDEYKAELTAKDEEIEKLKAEVKYLQSELDDYEQFRETIASARP